MIIKFPFADLQILQSSCRIKEGYVWYRKNLLTTIVLLNSFFLAGTQAEPKSAQTS